ncbi:MAG: ABC transporter permease [Trebonia sp.]|jgi:ABC-type transport system involved in multi-copper enzyme maturation permease subunit
MTLLLRAELLKLRTVRVTYGLILTVAALTALFAVIESSLAGKTSGTYTVASLATVAGQTTVTTLTSWSMILAAVLGILVASGEFRHSSATLTYLATPDRTRVLLAKMPAAALVGAVFGLVAAAISTGFALAFIAGRGDAITLGTAAMLGHAAGAMVGAALLATIGVGLGSLIRSQLVGIIAIFIWALVIESLIGGLFTSIRPYLPYTAATSLAGIKLGGAAFGPAHNATGGSPLPFAAAAGLLIGVAALIAVIGARTTMRRDIA